MKKRIKLFANVGIGNQIEFIPAMKILYKHGYEIYTDSNTLNLLVPELLRTDKLHSFDFGIVFFSLGITDVFKAKRICSKVIGFPFSFKFAGHRTIPIISNLLYDNKIKFDHKISEVENNVRLLSYLGITDEEIDYTINIPRQKHHKVIGISAGSGGNPQKRWQKWSDLIDHLDDYEIWLFGTEIELNNKIKQESNHQNIRIVQSQNIREAAVEIGKCELFIANDNGLMHLADIMKVPLIAIFGMTDQKRNGPWNKKSIVVSLNLECAPCYRYGIINCIYKNEQRYKCMNISVDMILEKIKELEI